MDERLRSWLDSPDERWWSRGTFGATAAMNSTSACRLCGAVVYDIHAHEAYHRAAVVEGER